MILSLNGVLLSFRIKIAFAIDKANSKKTIKRQKGFP